jgi:uncharacterized protein
MNNTFIIPISNKQYIVYLPIQGILFKGNTAVVNLFYKAMQGDESAQAKFGLTPAHVNMLNQNEGDYFKRNKDTGFKPTTVSLFLTSGCSMKCMYCYADAGEKNHQIKKEYIEVAVN